MAKDGDLTVSVDVTNTGSRAGDEVVQLYVKHLRIEGGAPAEELKGFQRVTLQPNETKTVEIPLKASSAGVVGREAARLPRGGGAAQGADWRRLLG